MTKKQSHIHVYNQGKGNVDICNCGKFQFNEKSGPPIVEQKKRIYPPTLYCNKCEWVHEADSVAKTSFQGVRLCIEHAAAPELLASAKKAYIELAQIAWLNPGKPNEARVVTNLRSAIAKAEGKE